MKRPSSIAAATPPASVVMGHATARRAALLQAVRKSTSFILGCADQAIVSLSSFAALVMVGRWTDPGQLGAYAVGFSILALVMAVQEALISRPYTIYIHRPLGTTPEHAFHALVLSIMLGALSILVAGSVAFLLLALYGDSGTVEIVWALAAAIPFVLVREFARRFAFAHLNVSMALKVDVAAAIITIGTIGVLGWINELSAARAIVAIGFACGLASVGWLFLARSQFAWNGWRLVPEVRRNWSIGKWFLSAQMAVQMQGYMVLWIALAIAGAGVAGIYAACASIMAFANPFIYGICNVLMPKYVNALHMNDVRMFRRRVVCDAVLLATVMIAFCLLVLLLGDWVMRLLYGGAEYAGHTQILVVLAAAALVAASGIPASLALMAAERARTNAAIKAGGAVLTVLVVSALLPWHGILGASYGILAVEAAISIGQWVALLLLIRTHKAGLQTASAVS